LWLKRQLKGELQMVKVVRNMGRLKVVKVQGVPRPVL